MGILAFASCANNEQWNNIHTVKVSAAEQADKKKELSPNGDSVTTPELDITVDMEFMDTTQAENAEACRKINRQLIESFLNIKESDDTEQAVKTFISNLHKEYEQDDMASEIYDHYTGKAEYGKDGVINYTLIEDYYGGGAHPSLLTTILRFDTNTGDRIDLYGFFTDSCTASLNEKLTKRLMEEVGAPTLDSLHNLGYLEMQEMFPSKNFLLRKDSISFFYNQYDIAPYALGSTTLSFGYDELKDFIRK